MDTKDSSKAGTDEGKRFDRDTRQGAVMTAPQSSKAPAGFSDSGFSGPQQTSATPPSVLSSVADQKTFHEADHIAKVIRGLRAEKRDLSEAQFRAKLVKLGGTVEMMGYVAFSLPRGGRVCINRHNAGERRRDQLRYLTRQLNKHIASDEARRVAGVRAHLLATVRP